MHKHQHNQPRSKSGSLWLLPYADTLGMAASILCLVHCIALPMIVLAAPALSHYVGHDDRTHYCLAAFVAAFCVFGILPGYMRHSQKPVLVAMLIGLALVLFATFAVTGLLGETWELPLITVGNLLVVAAHYRNRKLLACTH